MGLFHLWEILVPVLPSATDEPHISLAARGGFDATAVHDDGFELFDGVAGPGKFLARLRMPVFPWTRIGAAKHTTWWQG